MDGEILTNGIEIEFVWFDDHVIELCVRGYNGRFAGTANLYDGHDALARVVAAFRGFPESIEDRREVELGTLDPDRAGGGARFRLRCTDAVGHVAVDVDLRTEPRHSANRCETADFVVSVEPAAIDDFVAALSGMTVAVGAVVRLRQARD